MVSSTSEPARVMEEAQASQRDAEEAVQTRKSKRGKSKEPVDAITALEVRISHLEGTLIGCQGDLETLEAAQEEVRESIEEMRLATMEIRGWFEGAKAQIDAVKAENQRLSNSMDELKADLLVCKVALGRGVTTMQGESRPRSMEVPRPREYGGRRDAKEIDHFLWQMERHFEALEMPEGRMLSTATSYLTDDAALWWRRKHAEIEKGMCSIATWEEFKRELKRTFYPENVVNEARGKMRDLKHKGSIRDYVQEFSSLMLLIPSLGEEEGLFDFMRGLKGWARQELKRCGVKTLAEAMTLAESLEEPDRGRATEREIEHPPSQNGPSRGNGGGVARVRGKEVNGPPKRTEDKAGGQAKHGQTRSCFLCGGPHFIKECPRRLALNALMGEQAPGGCTQMGGMEVINSVEVAKSGPKRSKSSGKVDKSRPSEASKEEGNVGVVYESMPREAPKEAAKDKGDAGKVCESRPQNSAVSGSHGLMVLLGYIKGCEINALVDSGASHNFISPKEAERLGLRVDKSERWVKAVNSEAQRVEGVARNVRLQLGAWEGKTDFTVTPLDSFDVVLGLEFLKDHDIVMVPGRNYLGIRDSNRTHWIYGMEEVPTNEQSLGTLILSTLHAKGTNEVERRSHMDTSPKGDASREKKLAKRPKKTKEVLGQKGAEVKEKHSRQLGTTMWPRNGGKPTDRRAKGSRGGSRGKPLDMEGQGRCQGVLLDREARGLVKRMMWLMDQPLSWWRAHAARNKGRRRSQKSDRGSREHGPGPRDIAEGGNEFGGGGCHGRTVTSPACVAEGSRRAHHARASRAPKSPARPEEPRTC